MVTDTKMPGMSGREVARAVRALRAEAIAAGVNAFIYKPAVERLLAPR